MEKVRHRGKWLCSEKSFIYLRSWIFILTCIVFPKPGVKDVLAELLSGLHFPRFLLHAKLNWINVPQFLILEIVPVIPRNCKIQGVTLKKESSKMLWRLVGCHGSVELHRQHRRGVCGLKERPMTQLGKLSLHNSWIQQLSQSPIHPKRNEDVPEAQSVFCEHQSSPVQSGTSVSHWGPGSWSSGSCLPSRAPPGWWCFGSRTLCWAARWPPAELTERRRPPLVWNKVIKNYFLGYLSIVF